MTAIGRVAEALKQRVERGDLAVDVGDDVDRPVKQLLYVLVHQPL